MSPADNIADGIPTRLGAAQAIAQALGLDPTLVTRRELREVAEAVVDATLERLSAAIAAHFPRRRARRTRAAVHGLASEAFARAALRRAGFVDENIVDVTLERRAGLHTVASAYGLALRVLTDRVGALSIPAYISRRPARARRSAKGPR